MKSFIILLGLTAALAASASAQSDPRYAKTSNLNSASNANVHVTRTKQPAGRKQITYYITTQSVTGSHLPIVVCRYEGRNYPMFGVGYSQRTYEQSEAGATGALSVGGALRELDPAITNF